MGLARPAASREPHFFPLHKKKLVSCGIQTTPISCILDFQCIVGRVGCGIRWEAGFLRVCGESETVVYGGTKGYHAWFILGSGATSNGIWVLV